MAIKQEIVALSGATAEYHRISEVHVDYTKREATISVLSYLGESKRDEEKQQTLKSAERQALMDELDKLVVEPTEDNEARRIELSEQINAMSSPTPESVEPRNMFMATYTIKLPNDADFTLAFAYGWLKEHIYVDGEDC